MTEVTPYVGEIRVFGGHKLPAGWAFCNGAMLPISDYDTLFNLIGTTYGGDGQETFGLPDLRGRVPMHVGNGVQLGEAAGQETVTLTKDQLPSHSHLMLGSVNPATRNTVAQNIPASMPAAGAGNAYGSVEPFRPLQAGSVAPVGGSEAHSNIQPYQCVTFMISLFGIFPQPGEEETK
jgi:microcystin-dependent protein